MGLAERAGLAGKVAVVVGGGGGLGAAVTIALADEGVATAFCDVDDEASASTEAALTAKGATYLAHRADATVPDELAGFYEAFDERFDRLDIVVNVVGGVLWGRFAESVPEKWAGDIDRNYRYALQSMHAAIPRIRAGGRGGSIVNFTTIEAGRGAAGFAVYAGAKAALTNFSRALAVELGPENIRVNLLAPDTTPSAGNARAFGEARLGAPVLTPEQRSENIAVYIPMGRPAMPEDLADGVLFLASDLSRCVTGTILHVDGGTWAASGFLRWPYGDEWGPVPGPRSAMRIFPG